MSSLARRSDRSRSLVLVPGLALVCAWAAAGAGDASGSTPVDVGYRSFSYGDSVNSTPTGEKPESKLWWNDGSWWGCLWDPASFRYEIHRFDAGSRDWVSTNVPVDTRGSSKCDVLWDGTKLYVASHIFSLNPGPVAAINSGRLYRFSYDPGTDAYSPDPGFPVLVNGSKSETLVLDKDSSGRLWVTWVEAGKVKVNRTLGADHVWGAPFDLPSQVTNLAIDDISAVIAFGGDRIGIMWSDQLAQRMRFSVHLDSDADVTWQPLETVLGDEVSGPLSDDHINLKTEGGYVYGVTKTNLTGGPSPLVYVSRRSPAGEWTNHLVGTKSEDHTRPILLIDSDQQHMHVLATSHKGGRSIAYRKTAHLADLVFTDGLGVRFIDSPLDSSLANLTSTKQNLTLATGMLAIASDQDTKYYLHQYLPVLPTASVADRIGGAGHGAVSLAAPAPNPSRFDTRLEFGLAAGGHVRLAIHDLAGRRVRSLADGAYAAGRHAVAWDGRDERGLRVPPGLYLASLVSGAGSDTRRIVRIR